MGGGASSSKVRTIRVKEAWDDTPKKADRPSQWGQWSVPKTGEALVMTADVGGTSSRIHIFMAPAEHEMQLPAADLVSKDRILHSKKYRNASFDSFVELVKTFMKEVNLTKPPVLACIGVAGVVVDNSVKFVNLGWTVSGTELMAVLGIARVVLINDFEAQGYGVLTIDSKKDCDVLQDVEPVKGAPRALVGAGTGLGEAFLTTSENGDYDVWPSEGGHAEFAPRQDGIKNLLFEMIQYLQIKYSARSRVSVERVVSGKGIANIYEFLAWRFPDKKSPAIHKRFVEREFDPAVVVEAATAGECELSQQAVELFVEAYGSESGVVALKYMPFGGLYLTGGVTARTKDFILGARGKAGLFMESFSDKGRVSPMLTRIPVYLVREEDLGEKGVRYKACRLWEEMQKIRQPSKGHMGDMEAPATS
mmetsp:Transcript_29697/g.80288  ORF Transcript_29697/g.80288 Transcript_29697/m.80288 type:complete len:421 (-) Transcript_29697:44-1306(-)|eukprot:CAMPEP_0171259624 /NCGR_PEP_ID=MMETSP0790-20130122/55023_1 /TAXON_ID=2925 /ORGANISM="Alexandrium catenella, Strain OF101" /LENGTH=420 /DNA_ID=CAMNT_0011727903 /DNA_START=47 /DNA_END=1309 /DNA_ORIENTATION=+